MMKHSDATRTGHEPGARARRPDAGRDRRVSERIYDYILAGRPAPLDQRGARPGAAPTQGRAGCASASDTPS
jgi:hypothetical protein